MEYIERPKEVNKSEAGVQSSEYIQKNMQGQLNNIYDYLDKLIDSVNDIENAIQKIGLGSILPILKYQELNDVAVSGFIYANACTVSGTTINNGYLLTLVMSETYKVQLFIDAYDTGILKYRKCVNGVWSSFANV